MRRFRSAAGPSFPASRAGKIPHRRGAQLSAPSAPLVAALQASELLPQLADAKYPGPGKALIEYAWSPFAVEKDVIFIGASDEAGLNAGIAQLLK